MAKKILIEMEMQVEIARVWKAFRDPALLVEAVPEKFKAVEILQGNGCSVGSVKKLIFAPGAPLGPYVKEKIVAVDEGSYTIVLEHIEGGYIGNVFKNSKITLKLFPVALDSTKLQWIFECEPLVPDPPLNKMKEASCLSLKCIKAHLISNMSNKPKLQRYNA